MKAAVFEAFGSPLTIKDVPAPVLGSGGDVVVDVKATKVLAYMGDVLSGKRNYLLEPPMIPGVGAIGRIAAIGPDATELAVGDWVFCDATVRARDNATSPTTVLQGLTAGEERGRGLMRYVRDGSWAEKVRVPTENVTKLGSIADDEAPAWATLGSYLVPHGGFDAVGLRPGEIALVSGATGSFGSAAVAVALAMGASAVVATGRNRESLDDLARRFGARVRPVAMMGDEEADRRRIVDAAPGPVDVVLDLLPPAASPAQARAAARTVRPFGRIVLMGGIRDDIALPYSWLMRSCITVRGQWMYSRESIGRAIALVRAGLLRLDAKIETFALERVDEAIAHAAANARPFEATILRP